MCCSPGKKVDPAIQLQAVGHIVLQCLASRQKDASRQEKVVCLKLWIYYSYFMGSLSAPYFLVNGEIKQNKSNLDVPLHLPISQKFCVTCLMSHNYSMHQPFEFNLNRAKRVTLHVLLLVSSRTTHSPH